MAAEEVHHRTMLFDLYRSKFGDYLPLIRRQDVKGFVHHKPLWLVRPLGLDEVRKYAEAMEYETARFYRKASQSARDASVRQLLDKLAEAEDLALFAMLGQALSASIHADQCRPPFFGAFHALAIDDGGGGVASRAAFSRHST
jgi:erythrin-vacuolar iron transport family protein